MSNINHDVNKAEKNPINSCVVDQQTVVDMIYVEAKIDL